MSDTTVNDWRRGTNTRIRPPKPTNQAAPTYWVVDRQVADPAIPAAVPTETVVRILDEAIDAYGCRARLMCENPDLYLVRGHRHELHVVESGVTR